MKILRVRTTVATAVVGFTATVAALGPQNVTTRNFDADPTGVAPAGFTLAAMRLPGPGAFLVRREGTNGYLIHLADSGRRGYSMAIAPGEPLRDLVVEARLKLTGGSLRAGIVSRYHDARNFYVTVLDLGRGQLRMTRVFRGNHSRIEFKDDLQLDTSGWHTLKIIHHDNWVYAYLGGIRVFEDGNPRNRAFAPGRSGVMAFADSEAWFDDIRVEPDRHPRGRR